MDAAPSRTAMSTAVARGRHRLEHDPPWVFDDTLALDLVGPVWRTLVDRASARYPAEVDRQLIGGMVGRARYTEDRLALGGQPQYVLLGAGLDTFGWRHAERLGPLRVFEVDHPASQAHKRERAAALGLPAHADHVFVAVDFETQSLAERLEAAGFDRAAPACVSWLGVTVYLTPDAIEATLRTVAGFAPGSEIVMTYARSEDLLDDIGRRFREIAATLVALGGEPFLTRMSREEAEDLVARCGLEVAEHPDRQDMIDRYFADRGDGLLPYTSEGILAARVTG